MKKSHIFIIAILAVAVAIIISTAGDSSTYASFNEAYTKASTGNSSSVHVVGQLKKDAQGNILGIEEGADKVSFSFVMVDDNRQEQLVQYRQPMPTDFTKSEKVVVVGSYKGDIFIADKILLKCPSKYQEENVKI
jgi:cytochrome c-type biogenesis protein CcmE